MYDKAVDELLACFADIGRGYDPVTVLRGRRHRLQDLMEAGVVKLVEYSAASIDETKGQLEELQAQVDAVNEEVKTINAALYKLTTKLNGEPHATRNL